MDQPVQFRKVLTIDPQKVVGFAGQRPGADDFRLKPDQPGKGRGRVGAVAGHLHLHEGLHGKAQPRRVQPRRVGGDQPLGLKPLAAATGLAGRQVQFLPQFLRGQVGIALHQRQQALVGFVQFYAWIVHDAS